MAITPRPSASADSFIDGAQPAPSAAKAGVEDRTRAPGSSSVAPRRVRKGNKVQISVTLDEDLLDDLTAHAKRLGISRAAFMTIACREAIARGISLGGA